LDPIKDWHVEEKELTNPPASSSKLSKEELEDFFKQVGIISLFPPPFRDVKWDKDLVYGKDKGFFVLDFSDNVNEMEKFLDQVGGAYHPYQGDKIILSGPKTVKL
jgi:hypothetical protein